ncbi:VOC family protein [Micromonospora sp. CPCC 205558]|uniref:VOC family protein n=1 Tax=Micromonospora sp. CPCC 205558 TaxID=3122403 RepID=UPI002FF000AB
MSSTIHNISIDCSDTYALAGFWAQVFDCPRQPDDFPGDPEAMLLPPGGPEVLFLAVPEGKTVKNRLHLDLQPADRTRAEEVERLLGIGAMLVDDQTRPDGTGWVVLADPEGNEFCVLRSAAERAATSATPADAQTV